MKPPFSYYGGKQTLAPDIVKLFPEHNLYCDPPYYNSDCGHYDGYTREDMEMLLKTLSKIEGKFIVSSYPSDLLAEFAKAQGWHQKQWIKNVSVNKGSGGGKKKIEVVTANFPLIDS